MRGWLVPRDLRVLDFNVSENMEPQINPRRHCVVFSLDPLRGVITKVRRREKREGERERERERERNTERTQGVVRKRILLTPRCHRVC
jgi:hypothetical protein